MDAASRAAVHPGTFDRLWLGSTVDGLSTAAAHGAFEGQSDRGGSDGRARMGAPFFSPFVLSLVALDF